MVNLQGCVVQELLLASQSLLNLVVNDVGRWHILHEELVLVGCTNDDIVSLGYWNELNKYL